MILGLRVKKLHIYYVQLNFQFKMNMEINISVFCHTMKRQKKMDLDIFSVICLNYVQHLYHMNIHILALNYL